MTKTDFVAIQCHIADMRGALPSWPEGSNGRAKQNRVIDAMARSIADVLAKQNVKFKREEFLKGCGVE